jgi:O-antigen ligase
LLQKKVAGVVLQLEWVVLLAGVVAMWYPAPERDRWAWVLLLYLPVIAARYIVQGHLFTRTPLDGVFVLFFVLGLLNPHIAPYTRGYLLLARPLLGVFIYYSAVESARKNAHLNPVMIAAVGCALLVGVLSLSASQWNSKVQSQLPGVIAALPVLRGFPGANSGFNANEIAGAITYFVCLMAGVSVYGWKNRLRWRWVTTATFALLLVSLMLGQSRTAIVGVLLSFAIVIILLVPRGRWQIAAWAGLGLLIAFQIGMLANVFNPDYLDDLRERDANSLETRLNMWRQGVNILLDYPLSGVGLAMFRDDRVKDRYPIPRYEERNPPHIHNELLQTGMDMGIPGMVVFISFYVIAGAMLWKVWRRTQNGDEEDAYLRALVVAVGTGLLAHAVYGLADAVTLWDRLAFLFWGMLSLVGAIYIISENRA